MYIYMYICNRNKNKNNFSIDCFMNNAKIKIETELPDCFQSIPANMKKTCPETRS